MTDLHSSPGTGRFEVRVTADTHFGWLRTRLSVERTMMSWIRTAVSLIGFGFAIVQFFERLQQMPGTRSRQFPASAAISRPCAHFLRCAGASGVNLGIPMDNSLHVGGAIRASRRNEVGRKQGANAFAGDGHRRSSCFHRPVRFLCCIAASSVDAGSLKQPRQRLRRA